MSYDPCPKCRGPFYAGGCGTHGCPMFHHKSAAMVGHREPPDLTSYTERRKRNDLRARSVRRNRRRAR